LGITSSMTDVKVFREVFDRPISRSANQRHPMASLNPEFRGQGRP
jgi:hypothetical protein